MHVSGTDQEREGEKGLHEHVAKEPGKEHESTPRQLVAPYEGDRVSVPTCWIRHRADDSRG